MKKKGKPHWSKLACDGTYWAPRKTSRNGHNLGFKGEKAQRRRIARTYLLLRQPRTILTTSVQRRGTYIGTEFFHYGSGSLGKHIRGRIVSEVRREEGRGSQGELARSFPAATMANAVCWQFAPPAKYVYLPGVSLASGLVGERAAPYRGSRGDNSLLFRNTLYSSEPSSWSLI